MQCAVISPSLIESELFGHKKGAFTGAQQAHAGLIETAGAGTLFLDEIGDLAPELQGKLLRLLEEREYVRVGDTVPRRTDARIIAATHRDLKQAVKAGRFREDLYYRLSVPVLRMPACASGAKTSWSSRVASCTSWSAPSRRQHGDVPDLESALLAILGGQPA